MWLERVEKIKEEVRNYRRELHRIPELGFQLEKTAGLVENYLKELGIKPRRLAGTGIVADIESDDPNGPVIGLRADMDAMPVEEDTGLSFSSEHPGAMHACGHDAHMAMLLGAARLLLENKDKWSGRVRLIFQPAEEYVSGARKMIEEGVLEEPPVEAVFGLHIWQSLETGLLGVKPGVIMAATDNFGMKIKGKAAHGAMPHQGKDALAAAADLMHGIQSRLSRVVPTTDPFVMTFGKIRGGTKGNIVAEEVEIDGTFRCFSPEIREIIRENFAEYREATAKAHGVEIEYTLQNSAHPVYNDPELTEKLEKAFSKDFGEKALIDFEPVLPSEDFSEFGRKVPSVFFFLGGGGPEYGYSHHHSRFDINEEAMPLGVSALALAVETYARGGKNIG